MSTDTEKQTIRVLFLASEAAPLVKVGGLGDVAGSLPPALRTLAEDHPDQINLDVRLVLPFHYEITKKIQDPKFVASFLVAHPGDPLPAKAFLTTVDKLPVYLIEGPPIPPDIPVYSPDHLADGIKYVFFSMAVLEMLRHLDWTPDIIHANDWHTAAAIYMMRQRAKREPMFGKMKSIITIHNLPFMGADAEEAMIRFGVPRTKDPRVPYWGTLFPLPLGMLAADKVVAVSPGYADEILTPEFGCGLQDFLATRKSDLSGILNGLDMDSWDPATDQSIPVSFDSASLDKRLDNKIALQQEFNLPAAPDVPLLIMINRMDQQKGIDIAIEGLRAASDLNWQVILLGTGDPLLESACRSLESEYPNRVRAAIRFDTRLSRRMYAGGDILLMPSRYEPCGLAQMIAMRYGCVPLARATGGLKDTIVDDPTLQNTTGFLFEEASASSFVSALQRSLFVFPDRKSWQQIQLRGMAKDFSWEKSAQEYANLYSGLVENIL